MAESHVLNQIYSNSRFFVKGEHKREFAYETHTICDKNGFVLEPVVTPGNCASAERSHVAAGRRWQLSSLRGKRCTP